MTTQEIETAPASAAEAKPNKKGRVGARRAPVAPAKTKSGKKARRTANTPKSAEHRGGAGRVSKGGTILELLKRSGGVTAKELIKTTGWQEHSLRGFLSSLRKRMGLKIVSTKAENGERSYCLES